jgi:cytoskeletal protein RodZ
MFIMVQLSHILFTKGHRVEIQKSQFGSAHLIVIAIVIVLIGALGFVYWQNNIENKEVSVKNNPTVTKIDNDNSVANKIEDNNTQTKTEEPTEQIFSDALFAFNYPDTGWTIKANTFNGYEKTGYVSLGRTIIKVGQWGQNKVRV